MVEMRLTATDQVLAPFLIISPETSVGHFNGLSKTTVSKTRSLLALFCLNNEGPETLLCGKACAETGHSDTWTLLW
jgi:hypothetical protein